VLGHGKAVMYRVATAKHGFEWTGTHKVSAKIEWPSWSPPAEMRQRHPELPTFMEGGPENPLGARAMYLGSSLYRIHGTNAPESIGSAASSGCIRMLNQDVIELYQNVRLGAQVTVL
jgi:lipoprotein-anchoring transpeptidase ErfK/SrfK